MSGQVEIIRSARRKRSAQAYAREDGTIVVRVPATLGVDEERRIVSGLVEKVLGRNRIEDVATPEALLARAHDLADRYLDGVRAAEVIWSARMQRRWASCSVDSRRIRVSNRLAAAPHWVLDGILVHELAHLQVASHNADFHALVARYPEHDRVRGFLDGMLFAQTQRREPPSALGSDSS